MFKFLKEKLKSAISKISESVEKEGKIEEKIVEKPSEEQGKAIEKKEERGLFAKIKQTFTGKKEIEKEKPKEEKIGQEALKKTILEEKKEFKPKLKAKQKTEAKEAVEEEPAKTGEKKGLFASIKEKITTVKIDERQFDRLFWDLETALMENNVAVEVIEKLKLDLRGELVEKPIKRTGVEETVQLALKRSIEELFEIGSIDIAQEIRNKKKSLA